MVWSAQFGRGYTVPKVPRKGPREVTRNAGVYSTSWPDMQCLLRGSKEHESEISWQKQRCRTLGLIACFLHSGLANSGVK